MRVVSFLGVSATVGAVAIACAPAPPPRSTTSLPVVPAASVAPFVPKGCEGRTGLVLDAPKTVAASWNGSASVGGFATVTLRNCGTATLVLERLRVSDGARSVQELEFTEPAARLAQGASLEAKVIGSPRPATIRLVARAIADGAVLEADATIESVDDPKRTAAVEACAARHGEFKPAGMLGRELCDAPTADAGKKCTSRADCESACIADGTEVVPPTTAGAPKCGARMEVRRTFGHCHARTLAFGCHAFVEGPTMQCVPLGGAVGLSSICVD